MAKTYLFTSESVCAGHPDKICDAISDAILDAVFEKDSNGRVAVETLVTFNRVVIAGEVTSHSKINFEDVARNQIRKLGYTTGKFNFTDKSPIEIYIHQQSPEIARGVLRKGAGDQGMMYGFACKETKELMPLAIMIAHNLVRAIDAAREKKVLAYLRPDGKSQVTVKYQNGKPLAVKNVVIAVCYDEMIELSQVKKDVYRKIVAPVLANYSFKIKSQDLIVNGAGSWHVGGPTADTGVTGRKVVVDSYGGYARVGGGCFSGKDPTKVDRSGAYAARFIAKNIVAANLAEKAEVRLAYFIGAGKPVMQEVETFDTARTSQKVIDDFASKVLDTSVEGILEGLDLRRPIYLPTAAYGHFGREEFAWERIVS